MPRGGQNIKSKKHHEEAGNYRPSRHDLRLEVPVVTAIPIPPKEFDSEHRNKWNAICQVLKEADILARADFDAIRRYVESDITAKRTYATLLKDGFTIEVVALDKEGNPIRTSIQKHPLHLVYAEAVKTQRALFDQFGLTPRARMALKVDKIKPDEPTDPLDFLNN